MRPFFLCTKGDLLIQVGLYSISLLDVNIRCQVMLMYQKDFDECKILNFHFPLEDCSEFGNFVITLIQYVVQSITCFIIILQYLFFPL